MRSWSIPAGHILGIEVRIHLAFLLLLLFVLGTESVVKGADQALRALGLVVIIFGSVILHELGHAIVARRGGIQVRAIVLLPIGGVTIMEQSERPTPSRDIRVALAGPLVNLLLAAMSLIAILAVYPDKNIFARPLLYSGDLVRSFFWANVFLGAFNLLPAYPMDGGRVLRAMFAERMDYIRATRRAVTVGQMFAIVFILFGLVSSNGWLVMIGVFLFIGSQLEDRSAIFQSVLQSVNMREVMLTDFKTLSPADTLEDALHKAVHSLQDDFPVVRGTDLVGTISRQNIVEALRFQGNGYVQGVMNRMFDVAYTGDSLATVFRKLGRQGSNLVPVVDGDHLVGIVTMQNLTHSMALLAESRRLRREAETD